MKAETIKLLAMMFELCGQVVLSEGVQRYICQRLSEYPDAEVEHALRECGDTVKGHLSLAHIIELIPSRQDHRYNQTANRDLAALMSKKKK